MFTVGSLVPKNSRYVEVKIPKQTMAKKEPLQKIVVFQHEKQFEIQQSKGQLLLDAALQQRQVLEYKCRKGTCGICKVKMVQGASDLLPPNEKEQKTLKHALNEGYRLACQSIIK